jgi:hypothetical protein
MLFLFIEVKMKKKYFNVWGWCLGMQLWSDVPKCDTNETHFPNARSDALLRDCSGTRLLLLAYLLMLIVVFTIPKLPTWLGSESDHVNYADATTLN